MQIEGILDQLFIWETKLASKIFESSPEQLEMLKMEKVK